MPLNQPICSWKVGVFFFSWLNRRHKKNPWNDVNEHHWGKDGMMYDKVGETCPQRSENKIRRFACVLFFFEILGGIPPGKLKRTNVPLRIKGWKMYFLYRNRSFLVDMLVFGIVFWVFFLGRFRIVLRWRLSRKTPVCLFSYHFAGVCFRGQD